MALKSTKATELNVINEPFLPMVHVFYTEKATDPFNLFLNLFLLSLHNI